MQTEIKEAKVDMLTPRNSGFSVLIVDDEVTTRNLCRDVAVDAVGGRKAGSKEKIKLAVSDPCHSPARFFAFHPFFKS